MFVWCESIVTGFCEVPLVKGSKYLSIEIQSACKEGVEGYIAILHVKPGIIDIIYEAKLHLNRAWAEFEPTTSHLQVRHIMSRKFVDSCCVVSGSRISVQSKFEDSDGSAIEFYVRATVKPSKKPMFTPSPPSLSSKCLRFLVMDEFSLLPKSSEITIRINGAAQNYRYFLLPKYLAGFTGARIGAKFLLAGLYVNSESTNSCSSDLNSKEVDTAITVAEGNHWFRVAEIPTIRTLANMPIDGIQSCGFRVISSVGQVASGQLEVNSSDSEIVVEFSSVTQDWKPPWSIPTQQLMRFVRLLRRRGQSWRCHIIYQRLGRQIRFKEGSWLLNSR